MLIYQEDMKIIARPLFDHSKISFFSFAKFFRDSTSIILTSHGDFSKALVESGYKFTYDGLKMLTEDKERINTFDNSFYFLPRENNAKANILAREYNITSIVNLVEKVGDTFECFIFGMHGNQNLMDFYFRNWDILINFKYYFLDAGSVLIASCFDDKIILKDSNNMFEETLMEHCSADFKKTIGPKNILVNYTSARVPITIREYESLKYLAQGWTVKEIAKMLNISPRTVEEYHKRIKEKLGINSRKNLIEFYLSSDLASL